MSATVQPVDRETWRRLAAEFDDYNYRQLWEFGVACAARVGARSEHVAIRDGDDVLGLADVRVKSVPLVGTGIAYITGGPMVRRFGNSRFDHIETCLRSLLREYVHRRGFVLRVLAPPGPPIWNDTQTSSFRRIGFMTRHGAVGYRTFLLDIARPLDEVRRGLARNWRKHLRQAESSDLLVRSGTSDADFEQFGQLYAQSRIRKNFHVDLEAAFYANVQRTLEAPERFHLHFAEYNDTCLAASVVSMLGDTCVCLLRADTETGRAMRVSHLLHWHAVRIAQQYGCVWYDLGGIDPEGNPGVYAFKSGLGGIDVTAPGPFECRPTRLAGAVVGAAERAYRGWRVLRRRVGRLT